MCPQNGVTCTRPPRKHSPVPLRLATARGFVRRNTRQAWRRGACQVCPLDYFRKDSPLLTRFQVVTGGSFTGCVPIVIMVMVINSALVRTHSWYNCWHNCMVIHSALVRSHQSTYKGSFGPVLLSRMDRLHPLSSRASSCGGVHPTSSHDAMPTSSPGSRCCIIKPLLAVG